MATIIITDVMDTTDDFIKIEMKEQPFWRVFHILVDLFQHELPADALNRFTGVAHAMDVQDITDIPADVFNKAVDVLEQEHDRNFVELIDKMQADPRFETAHA